MRSLALFMEIVMMATTNPGVTADQEVKVGANRVEFKSGGEKLVGVLRLPATYRPGDRAPVVVVAGPWTTVKEQTGGAYAAALAERGGATLVFDFRFFGESGGEPREFESPKHKIEDLKAAVAYLKTLSAVDPDRIGMVGVCFGAGYVVAAAGEDPTIKSVATVAAWLHDAASLKAAFGEEEIARRYKVGAAAQKKYEADKSVGYVPAHSTTDKTAAMFNVDFYADVKRGLIPQWKNQFAVMSWPGWLDFDAVSLAPKVKAPLLVIHSDGSALPDNARRLYKSAAGPKELYWTEGNHTDFYDKPAYVGKAADALAGHFRRTLARPTDSSAEVREFFAALEAMDIPRFLKVWAEDGVQEMPFAPGDFPKRLEGREAIRRQYELLPKSFEGMKFTGSRMIVSADPNVVVAEYAGSIGLKAGGRYDNRYVGVFVFRDGKLQRFTEYFDPFTLVRGFPGAAAAGATDEERVIAVVNSVASLADGRKWKELRAVFADEVDVDYTSLVGGAPSRTRADDLVAGWEKGLGRFAKTQHVVSGHEVKVDGDAANCRATFIATHARDADGKDRWTCGGRYHYKLKREGGRWLVTGTTMTLEWEQGKR